MHPVKNRNGLKIAAIIICLVILLALIAVVVILGTAGSGTLPPVETTPNAPQSSEAAQAKPKEDSGTDLWAVIQGLFDSGVKETEDITFGIDVAKYQGTIDWEKVAEAGVDFVMVRVGNRTMVDGQIVADSNAKYNMQEAQKYGIKLGAYFFSTAITKEEAIEEAAWVADFISRYSITYPVAYNCEGFNDPENRQYHLTKTQRTDIALAFLEEIEDLGYEAMFYASKNEMTDDAQWEVSRIGEEYKIWVAQYPENPYPETQASSYEGVHHMWQFTRNGTIPGIEQSVDVNVAYFGYDGVEEAKSDEIPETAQPDVEALIDFTEVNEQVTAKKETNLRDMPSQGDEATVLYTLKNGETATRTGISDSGWSRLTYNGQTYYAVSSYLTTDLDAAPDETEPDDGIETEFRTVSEDVTAKEVVNLRSIPSVEDERSEVLRQLKNGETAKRIGISDNGWSKLEIDGNIYYAVSNYLSVIGSSDEDTDPEGIQTQFEEVNEQVTAKEVVNLRTVPSVESEDSEVVAQLVSGEVITRTGINHDLGWSRVEYNGQILYCISSYLKVVE